jgi:hypothetical protein
MDGHEITWIHATLSFSTLKSRFQLRHLVSTFFKCSTLFIACFVLLGTSKLKTRHWGLSINRDVLLVSPCRGCLWQTVGTRGHIEKRPDNVSRMGCTVRPHLYNGCRGAITFFYFNGHIFCLLVLSVPCQNVARTHILALPVRTMSVKFTTNCDISSESETADFESFLTDIRGAQFVHADTKLAEVHLRSLISIEIGTSFARIP